MNNDEYTSRFLDLLRYIPCLKEEKPKIQRFTIGLSVTFKDKIDIDEPRSMEEAIQNLKCGYEQSKYMYESK